MARPRAASLRLRADRAHRHLDVMICLTVVARRLTVTASVVTHNAYCRIYMLPVGIAHRITVGRHIRHLRQTVQERAARTGSA
ncbi:DUF2867 domain-containing protein [Salipiger thiooxidans]|nr:DUF2867 domain-containing protein [Salipiger thiooxidans]